MNSDQWSGFLGNLVVGVVGIIGALAGILFDRLYRRLGKLHLHTDRWKLVFYGSDNSGGVTSTTKGSAEWAVYSFHLEAFNTRDEPTGLRNFRVSFTQSGRQVFTGTPQDEATRELVAMSPVYANVSALNLPPKQWVTLDLRGLIASANWDDLEQCRVVLSGVDPSGKEHHAIVRDAF